MVHSRIEPSTQKGNFAPFLIFSGTWAARAICDKVSVVSAGSTQPDFSRGNRAERQDHRTVTTADTHEFYFHGGHRGSPAAPFDEVAFEVL
jgi:hypothetical protein